MIIKLQSIIRGFLARKRFKKGLISRLKQSSKDKKQKIEFENGIIYTGGVKKMKKEGWGVQVWPVIR